MMLMFKHNRHHPRLPIRRRPTHNRRVAPERRVCSLFVAEHDVEPLEEAGAEDSDFVAAASGTDGGNKALYCGGALEVETLREV